MDDLKEMSIGIGDIPGELDSAIAAAGFSKEVTAWIWEKKYKLGEVTF